MQQCEKLGSYTRPCNHGIFYPKIAKKNLPLLNRSTDCCVFINPTVIGLQKQKNDQIDLHR